MGVYGANRSRHMLLQSPRVPALVHHQKRQQLGRGEERVPGSPEDSQCVPCACCLATDGRTHVEDAVRGVKASPTNIHMKLDRRMYVVGRLTFI